ncbi:MAG TPA: fluoride efflux transporter CrcB [Thermomicrobiales bacterium]|nr:fluoride efflux transporter CrcB [Thermomicrobiales bacterium]
MEILWVGIGGFIGANARFYLGREIGERLGTQFPYGTMIVNVSGAFLIGIIFTILTERVVADPLWRQLLVVGFLGGYTTFSSFTFEAVGLLQDGRWTSAILYLLGNNILGLVACVVGIMLARAIGS